MSARPPSACVHLPFIDRSPDGQVEFRVSVTAAADTETTESKDEEGGTPMPAVIGIASVIAAVLRWRTEFNELKKDRRADARGQTLVRS